MLPSKSMSMSETANRSALPAPHELSRGMYTHESIASMTPAHTSIESKVKAPSNSVVGMGLISNPLALRRSNRLAKISPAGASALDLDSPTCPPSLKAAKSRRVTTRAMSNKVAKSSKVSKNTKPAKKILPTAAVSKASEKKYNEIMKTYSASATASQPTPSLNSITQSSSSKQVVAVSTQVTVATQSKPMIKLSFKNLAVRSKV